MLPVNEGASRGCAAGWRTLSAVCALVVLAAPQWARAEPLCDQDWEGGNLVIQLGERKNDGSPLQRFDPQQPMNPYEFPGERYVFRQKGRVYRAVGRFQDRQEGEAALKQVYNEMPHLYTGSYPPFLSNPGAYLVTESRTCKINRKNPVIDPAWWILEKDGVLLVGSQTECKKGQLTKTVTVVSCDGMKNLMTDSVSVPCDMGRVNSCIHPVVPGVFAFAHSYSAPAQGTQVRLRVYDVPKKKRLHSIDAGHDGGPETELMSVQDIDNDGVPEIVHTIAGTGERTSVLKWSKGKFAKVKAP
ncbi:hypothetical protein KYC5002_47020 [Archangium violaceum]|uniref:hypothetical protein n=1 Tax=Archangium violaceum TaxID=83451 RepID=UPI002B2CD8FB|nr:hypothetical protein KYC5002_47020 [Archangium gephyra]